MKIYDISPVLSENVAVFPGDQAFERKISLDVNQGDPLTLSAITSTLHIGAHTDAPSHYAAQSEDISQRSLHYYFGKVQVIAVSKKPKTRIRATDLSSIKILAPRILFKTLSFENPNLWNPDFISCSADLIEALAKQGVKLVGIDTPSIDLSDCKILESHKAVAKNNMAILEGVLLTDVPEGIYTLIALPLKIKDADASPVRAILVDQDLGIA
jgi:arylformamidase